MATQRLILLKIVGESGRVVAERCRVWSVRQHDAPDDPEIQRAVGRFAETLDAHRTELPVVYYSEWLDRWSMFDAFTEPFVCRGGIVLKAGGTFHEICCTDHPAAMLTLPADGWRHDEQTWLAVRVREAVAAWNPLVPGGTLMLLRQVVGPSTLDMEITAALPHVPGWLETSTPP